LYKVHANLSCDLQSGGANHAELQPEPSCANRDGVACDLLAILRAPKDIDQIDPLARWERGGSGTERWEAGEARHPVAQRLWHWVDREDLPASCGECAQDAVGGAVWARGGADDRDGATLRQHAAHERVCCGGIWGAPFGGLYGCP
jgi:hypothetical protein